MTSERTRALREEFTLGSGAGCDVVLADNGVEPLHVRLRIDREGRISARDCDTPAGTQLLRDGRWLRLPTLADASRWQESEYASYAGDPTQKHAVVGLADTLRTGGVEKTVIEIVTELARSHAHLEQLVAPDTFDGRCFGCLERHRRVFEPCGHCGCAPGRVLESPHDLPPGSKLGPHVIGRAFSHGETVTFYVGWDSRLQQRVCVMECLPRADAARAEGSLELRPRAGADEAFERARRGFEVQARTLRLHADVPHVAVPTELLLANGTAYAIYSCSDVVPLVRHLGGAERLRLPWARPWIGDLVLALVAIHERGLLHGAVDPAHVLVGPNRARLILGESVRATGAAGAAGPQPDAARHAAGDVRGLAATLLYAIAAETPPAIGPGAPKGSAEAAIERCASLSWSEKEAFRRALAPGESAGYRTARQFAEALFDPPRATELG